MSQWICKEKRGEEKLAPPSGPEGPSPPSSSSSSSSPSRVTFYSTTFSFSSSRHGKGGRQKSPVFSLSPQRPHIFTLFLIPQTPLSASKKTVCCCLFLFLWGMRVLAWRLKLGSSVISVTLLLSSFHKKRGLSAGRLLHSFLYLNKQQRGALDKNTGAATGGGLFSHLKCVWWVSSPRYLLLLPSVFYIPVSFSSSLLFFPEEEATEREGRVI